MITSQIKRVNHLLVHQNFKNKRAFNRFEHFYVLAYDHLTNVRHAQFIPIYSTKEGGTFWSIAFKGHALSYLFCSYTII